MPEYLYRYDHYNYGEGVVKLLLTHYRIVKTTEMGHRISMGGYKVGDEWYGAKDKFVLEAARKHYACTTKELALESYKARKRCQIGHLEAQLETAKRGLFISEGYDVEADKEQFLGLGPGSELLS